VVLIKAEPNGFQVASGLNVSHKTIKFLENNIGQYLLVSWGSKYFSNRTHIQHDCKGTDSSELIKVKN
jgi:hypothetical protein